MSVAVALRSSSVPAGVCQFPAEWRGKWFESGVGDVIVTSHNISRKGICLENVGDFYLLENRCVSETEAKSKILTLFCVCSQSLLRLVCTLNVIFIPYVYRGIDELVGYTRYSVCQNPNSFENFYRGCCHSVVIVL